MAEEGKGQEGLIGLEVGQELIWLRIFNSRRGQRSGITCWTS